MLDEIRKSISAQLGISMDTVTEKSRLIDDLKADSLDIVDLVTGLEERYGLEISEDDLPTLKTVGDVAAYVAAHVESK